MMTAKSPRPSSSIEIVTEIVTIAVVDDSIPSTEASRHSQDFRPSPWFPKRDMCFQQGLAVQRDHHGLLPGTAREGIGSDEDDLA